MKSLLHPIFHTVVFLLLGTFAYADHLSDELLISSKLTGDQESPAVMTEANGVASFTLNATRDTLFVNAAFQGLSGPITGIHVHEGAPGFNGPVVTGLTDFVRGNRVIAFLTGDDLTPEMLANYLSGDYYLNVHTDLNPAGEIRGQLVLETDFGFRADLDAEQQTDMVMSEATGLGYFVLGRNMAKLEVRVSMDGLSGPATAAHFHYGMPGEAGGVVVDLTDFIDGNSIVATLDASMPADFLENLMDGNIYLNVHTDAYPNGEIRGQVWMDEGLAFDAWLNTEQETTPTMMADGYGSAYFSLSPTFDELMVMVQTTGLTGDITGAHLHMGAPGTSGGVVINLSDGIMGNRIMATVSGMDLTADVINDMLKGELYLNVHTDMNPDGEIRGQVYRNAREGYAFALESNQEIPKVFSVAKGAGLVTVDRNQSNAHVMMVLSDLTGPLQMAHFHEAAAGMNGDVIYNLTPWFDGESSDAAFLYWTDEDDTPFTSDASVAFRIDLVYVNVHTELNPSGELRGQVIRGAEPFEHQTYDAGMSPEDPKFTTGILFSTKLTGGAEVPAVETDALGVAGFLLNETRDTLMVNINLDGLSGPITGMHIHEAPAGENGGVVIDLSDMLTGNQARGTITNFDLNAFIQGDYYVNVHTDANPDGEIRGQIAFENDWTFLGDLNGEAEVPTVETDAIGRAIFNLGRDNGMLEVRVVTTGLSGPITGAHLHLAPAGENGDVVLDLTDFITDNSIVADLVPGDYLDDLKAGNLYLNVHTEANPGGEIRGQVELASAFVFDTWMNGAQSTSDNDVPGRGAGVFWLNETWDAINYDIVVDQISGMVDAIHIHGAGLGMSGDVLVDLSGNVMGNRISGTISAAAITPELLDAMILGDTYVNLHTAAFPNGEIRGQIHRLARDGYNYVLCGEQEVPAVDTDAYGGGILSIDRNASTAHVMFTSTALTGPITGAHLHNAMVGANGDVLYGLTDILLENSGFVYREIDTDGADLIKDGTVYLNLHTDANPDGELRGQIDNESTCPLPDLTIGVDELTENHLNAYPNPMGDVLTVALDPLFTAHAELTLRDGTGRTVKAKSLTNGSQLVRLSTADLPSGLYFLKVKCPTGSLTTKLVK